MTVRVIINTLRVPAETIRPYMWADVSESALITDENDETIGLIWDAPDYVTANSQSGRLTSGLIGSRVVVTDDEEADAVKDIRLMAQWRKNKA